MAGASPRPRTPRQPDVEAGAKVLQLRDKKIRELEQALRRAHENVTAVEAEAAIAISYHVALKRRAERQRKVWYRAADAAAHQGQAPAIDTSSGSSSAGEVTNDVRGPPGQPGPAGRPQEGRRVETFTRQKCHPRF